MNESISTQNINCTASSNNFHFSFEKPARNILIPFAT